MKIWPTASNLKIDAGDGNLTLYMGLDADVLVYEMEKVFWIKWN